MDSPRGAWISAITIGLVCAALQAVGLVSPIPLLVWSIAVGGLLALSILVEPGPLELTGAVRLLVPLALVTAGQLVPLPGAVLGFVSPHAVEVRSFGLPSGWSTGPHPLSLDAPATWMELVKYVSYASVALVCALCARHTRARSTLAWGAVLTGGLFALASIWRTLSGSEDIWGAYRPVSQTFGLLRAPLVNANHIAGVFSAVLPLTVALALRSRWRVRLALLVLAVVEVILVLLTLSRGGAVACLAGLGMFAAGLARRRRQPAIWLSRVAVVAVAFAALALGWGLAGDRISMVLDHSREAGLGRDPKVMAWSGVIDLARDYWLPGAGRGTFAVAFTRYQLPLGRDTTFHYAENLPLQLLSEWGAPVALLVTVMLSWWLVRAWRGRGTSRTRLGALTGLMALIGQNLVDFSLEVPAIAALAVVLATLSEPGAARRGSPGPWTRWPRYALAAAAVLVPIVAWPTVAGLSYRVEGERLAGLLRASDQRSMSPMLRREARGILARHPSDYALPLLLGEWSAAHAGAETFCWLNRALFLNPRAGAVHLAIGRALSRGGLAKQALLELRLAHSADPFRSGEIASFVAARYRSLELLRRYIGTGRGSAQRAQHLAAALRDGRHAREWGQVCELLANRHDRAARLSGLACAAQSAREVGERSRTVAFSMALARERPPAEYVAAVVPLLQWAGESGEADDVLRRALVAEPYDQGLLALAAEVSLARAEGEKALEWSKRLERTAGTSGKVFSDALLLQGRAYLMTARPRLAVKSCSRGLDASPERPDLLRCVADAAFVLADFPRSRAAYLELEARGLADDELRLRLRGILGSQ